MSAESYIIAAFEVSRLYPVFPCRPYPEGKMPAKSPRTDNGFKDATRDYAQIQAWWAQWPDSLIGVPTGRATGMVVVDDDTVRKPDSASSVWLDRNVAYLVSTRQQMTRSGGHHFIFAMPASVDIKSVTGITVNGEKLSSIDTRGEGGYIIWWKAHGCACQGEIQPLPQALIEQLPKVDTRRPTKRTHGPAPGIGLHPAHAAEMPAVLNNYKPADRDDWIEVGMALHHVGGEEAFEIYHRFAAGEFTDDKKVPENYHGRDDCLATYGSFGKNPERRPLTLRTVFAKARQRSIERAARAANAVPKPPASIPPPPAGPPAPVVVLTQNRRMQYDATLEALVYKLGAQTQASIGFDEFRGRVMIAPAGTKKWQPLSDTDMIGLRENFAREQYFAPIGKELMRDALELVADRYHFDSAIMWLEGLRWDGQPRIEYFLADYCGAAADDYTRAVSLYIWTGLAGRVLDPGCQLDMVVAFQSPQGRMKSTGFQAMVPADDWFTDGLSLHEDDDDFKRLIRGKLLIEVAEMAGLSKGDINVVKRVITRRREEWIEKFQTQPTTFKRRCMLFASTNEEHFLPPDETGQRRWLPVEIEQMDRDRIAADRDQLWAEAATHWRTSGIAWADAERLAKDRHAKYEQSDVWETTIEQWLNAPGVMAPGLPPTPPPRCKPLTLSEVLMGAIGLNAAHQDARAEKRAARVMRALGFEPRPVRVGGGLARRWVPRE